MNNSEMVEQLAVYLSVWLTIGPLLALMIFHWLVDPVICWSFQASVKAVRGEK